jgi:hypothetical protein
MSFVPNPEELAQLDAFAEETGAQHADRVLELLTEYPSELVPEVLDFAQAMLDNTLAGLAAGLRERTATPESEIEHFIILVRSAYSARLALVLMPAAGNG